jgi:hypothetical protein
MRKAVVHMAAAARCQQQRRRRSRVRPVLRLRQQVGQ